MANIKEIVDKFTVKDEIIKIKKIPVAIRTSISANDFTSAVRTIVNSCLVADEDDESGEIKYNPEYKEIVKRYVVLRYLTDIELGDMTVTEIYELSQRDWYREIEEACANYSPIHDIQKAVDELIDYQIFTRQTKFDEACESVKKIADKVFDIGSLSEIAKKLSNMDDKAIVEAIIDK